MWPLNTRVVTQQAFTNTHHVPELAKTWIHSREQNLGPSEGDALSHSVQRAGLQAEENVSTGETVGGSCS